MNLVLFEPGEWLRPLPASDPRARHLTEILKLEPGDRFAAGQVGGQVGTLAFQGYQGTELIFSHAEWTSPPPRPARIHLVIGTPRPLTARRLLKDLTTLGAAELHFVATELGDKSYLQSTLWTGEYRKSLLEGAAQARTTLLPMVKTHGTLRRALTTVEGEGPSTRVWFDEGGAPWDRHSAHGHAHDGVLWLALGPERGWTTTERALFAEKGWQPAGLGPRTLRTETACALAMGIGILQGWLDQNATPGSP